MLTYFTTKPGDKIIELYCSYIPKEDKKLLYRYDIAINNYNDSGIVSRVYLSTYPVVRETEASYFFDENGVEKRVLKGDGKRYAHDSIEKALFSLKKRTRWRMSHAHWAMTKAHEAIDIYNELFGKDDKKPLVKIGTI